MKSSFNLKVHVHHKIHHKILDRVCRTSSTNIREQVKSVLFDGVYGGGTFWRSAQIELASKYSNIDDLIGRSVKLCMGTEPNSEALRSELIKEVSATMKIDVMRDIQMVIYPELDRVDDARDAIRTQVIGAIKYAF